jgi:F-type H+-transporting ATPase subunit a
MMAGHTLLKILCNFLWKFTKFFFGPLIFQGIIFWLLIVIIFILETLIAFLQAAVYVMLVNIYMNDLINMH